MNFGVAFGILKNIPDIALILSIISFILIFFTAIFGKFFEFRVRFSLAIMSGGALSNLLERIFFGAVFDWIPFPFLNINFNIADVEISIGALFAFIFIYTSFSQVNFDNNEIISELKNSYGVNAQFREGQLKAIQNVLNGEKILVVERTGWGKSLVYFLSTKLLRKKKSGITIVISPLLSLMENQMLSALKFGLKCEMLNSLTSYKRTEIFEQLKNNELDLIFTSPETLMKNEIQNFLTYIKINFLVVDEAHCISEWGHDFRLDYTKLKTLVKNIHSRIPILATTATANDRVIEDIKIQFGNDLKILKGSLSRESLHIQVLKNMNTAERLAWLLENLNKIPGTGIIYCLTRRECEFVSSFLKENGINSESYYSRKNPKDEIINKKALELFTENKIKVIVATVKLGMGYDKEDISFVIHYNTPPNIISWYQQIGRAGRNISDAYIFLMSSFDDEARNKMFMMKSFPEKHETEEIMQCIRDSVFGITEKNIESKVNSNAAKIRKALDFLEHDGFTFKHENKYFVTSRAFKYNDEHYEKLRALRLDELQQVTDLIRTEECYTKFSVNCLDDFTARDCKKCSNCTGEDIIENLSLSQESIKIAKDFMKSEIIIITPLEKLPNGEEIKFKLMSGICLSRYGAEGVGDIVKRVKYSWLSHYPDEIIEIAAEKLFPVTQEHEIKNITFIPSLRNKLVDDFAERLALKMGLEFSDLLVKTDSPPQKNMQNDYYQCENVKNSFSIRKDIEIPEKVILIDDIIDSGWTLNICGMKLMQSGCEKVFPFALADSGNN